MRGLFQTLLLSLIVAVAANGVVMAASGAMHQEHCMDAPNAGAANDFDHAHHAGLIASDAPEAAAHDHETCMTHACSAIALGAQPIGEIPLALLTVLTATENRFVVLERTDGLLRPPNT